MIFGIWVSIWRNLGRNNLTPAENLLQHLGVTRPDEIDLEAIAWFKGATVKYRPLKGCEARIIGFHDSAVISIHDQGSSTRKRYSLAHELGHWEHHRGQTIICRSEDIDGRLATSVNERVANSYAADLLMPGYLFDPIAEGLGIPTVKKIDEISSVFAVSKHAGGRRLVARSAHPFILVCHSKSGRKWFTHSSSAPAAWMPRQSLDVRTSAFEILFANKPDDSHPKVVPADAWFDGRRGQYFQVREQSFRSFEDETLSLIHLADSAMLTV